jgi:hypothetical protein
MLDRFIQSIRSFSTPDRLSISICLFLSAIGWFLTKMSKEYNHQMTFALKYQLPGSLAFESSPPESLNADLRASGWSLLRLSLSSADDTILLDESRIFEGQISTRILLGESLHPLAGDELAITNVSPQQLQLTLVERHAKKVPIWLDGEIILNTQYQLKEPLRFDPDSVTIFGSEDHLARLNFWPTSELTKEEVDQDFRLTMSLRNAAPAITTDITETTLDVKVDQVTEKEIYVPVTIPDSLAGHIRIFPGEVLIKVNLGLSRYEEVNSDDFRVELKKGPFSENRREVVVTALPEFVNYMSHTPSFVDFYRSNSSEK